LPEAPCSSLNARSAFPSWVAGCGGDLPLHRSGLVLKHVSVHAPPGRDTDIIGGMMAAVRIFVEDSLRPSTGALREVRFRGGNVVFVNGKNVTLAAVNPRGTGARFPDRATRVLRGV